MFTGIIEETGVVKTIYKRAKSSALVIQGKVVFQDLRVGDSVAVNGVCLTVSSFSEYNFCADVMHETLSRSSLGSLKAGSRVNLERAMPANGRFGGHMVSGHIDGVGVIKNIKRDDNAIWYTIHTTDKIMRYIVEKGSVAIDGISLTVANVMPDCFYVSVIPHTAKHTTLSEKSIGSNVNLENDLIGKYVEKLIGLAPALSSRSAVTREFLTENGY